MSPSSDEDLLAATAAPAFDDAAREPAGPGPSDRGATDDLSHIGRFVVTRRLGSGAMGIVLEGRDDVLERRVAIKLIAPERAKSGQARERMLREAQALAKLSHPNVVPVYEAGTHDGQIFVAMEYVEGRTLREVADTRRPGWRSLVTAYIQAARGLCAAHDAGLVHRDFKPDTAMLGDDGRVRVLDFGLVADGRAAMSASRQVIDESGGSAGLTRTGAMMGTPAYMAPEQYLGEPVDARADQFAFCVALHEAVYGARPHSSKTATELAVAVIEGKIEVPARREPRWLYRVLRRGLATDPAARYPDLHAVIADLERGLARRRRALVAGVAALSAIGLVVAARIVFAPSTVAPTAAPSATSQESVAAPRAYATARQVTRVSDDVQISFDVSISEDGEAVAYWRIHRSQLQLTIANARTGLETSASPLVGDPLVGPLQFLPSGDLLMFGTVEPTKLALVRRASAGLSVSPSREIPAAVVTGLRQSAAISPTGEAIAAFDPASHTLMVYFADGKTRQVAPYAGEGLELSWSPNGSLLAWVEIQRGAESADPRIVVASVAEARRRDVLVGTDLLNPPHAGLTFVGDDHLAWSRWSAQSGLAVGEILEQRLDPSTLALIGSPRSLTPLEPGVPAMLSATGDGRHIAFVRKRVQVECRVAPILDAGGLGPPQTTTSDISDEHLIGWSPDAEILFASERSGSLITYARRLPDASVRVLGPVAASVQRLRGDGRDVILLERPDDPAAASTVVRVSPTGDRHEVAAIDAPRIAKTISCALDRCTFASWEGDEVVIRDLAWPNPRPQVLARVRLSSAAMPQLIAWSMAPDATRGALVDEGSEVHIVSLTDSNTRALDLPATPGSEPPMAQYATWRPDGKGLYVTGMFMGGELYGITHIGLDGVAKVVHTEANRWLSRPFVSPDGAHLAFASRTLSGQLWILERDD